MRSLAVRRSCRHAVGGESVGAGELMPPKSTWFEPKLADGLLAHVLD